MAAIAPAWWIAIGLAGYLILVFGFALISRKYGEKKKEAENFNEEIKKVVERQKKRDEIFNRPASNDADDLIDRL